MTDYCIDLDLGLGPIVNVEDLHKIDKSTYMHVYKITELINPKLIVKLLKMGLTLNHAEIFYSPPSFNAVIHTDISSTFAVDDPNDFVKLNFIYYGNDSTMNWYEPIEGAKPDIKDVPNIYEGKVDVTAEYYNLTNVKLLHQQKVNFPSIVQVAIPHNSTTKTEERFCIGIIILKDGKRITMQHAKEIFKQYII